MFLASRTRPVRRAYNLSPSMRRVSRQCVILNISQPFRPPRPVIICPSTQEHMFTKLTTRPLATRTREATPPENGPTFDGVAVLHGASSPKQNRAGCILTDSLFNVPNAYVTKCAEYVSNVFDEAINSSLTYSLRFEIVSLFRGGV
jgi:hypothetical protein